MAVNIKGKSLISIQDLTLEEIWQIFDLSAILKLKRLTGEPHRVLEGKKLGMIFSKPSTRTRVSFEVGIYESPGYSKIIFSWNKNKIKR
jgi:ornithine carbamoyltransferase